MFHLMHIVYSGTQIATFGFSMMFDRALFLFAITCPFIANR
jgi:hypothetical protein